MPTDDPDESSSSLSSSAATLTPRRRLWATSSSRTAMAACCTAHGCSMDADLLVQTCAASVSIWHAHGKNSSCRRLWRELWRLLSLSFLLVPYSPLDSERPQNDRTARRPVPRRRIDASIYGKQRPTAKAPENSISAFARCHARADAEEAQPTRTSRTMRSFVAVALALAAGAHAVAVESESRPSPMSLARTAPACTAHLRPHRPRATRRRRKDGAGVRGKDGGKDGRLKDLDAKTVAAKFAWYVDQFEKTYDIEEYADRLKGLLCTLREIHQHEEDHKVGLNKFSDWTIDEFEAYQTYKPSPRSATRRRRTRRAASRYRRRSTGAKEGLVADVKDQGSCGSCWTFSTVASIEGAHAKKHGKMVTLSEQNLVDCVKKDRLPSDAEDCCDRV